MSKLKVVIVSPCYYDTLSFLKLRKEVKSILSAHPNLEHPTFVLIDDSAGQDPKVAECIPPLGDVRVITPPYNLGSQGALVFSLRKLSDSMDEKALVITMDSDGQDRPQDLPLLIEPIIQNEPNLQLVSIAVRTHREETLVFKLLYLCFVTFFRLAVGMVVKSGTFACYRGWLLKEVIFHPHFNHVYASSFISLPLERILVPIPRGKRYFEKSRTSYYNLIGHGLKMMIPFTERIAIRGLIASFALAALTIALYGAFSFLPVKNELSWLNGGLLMILLIGWAILIGIFFALFVLYTQNKAAFLHNLHEKAKNKPA